MPLVVLIFCIFFIELAGRHALRDKEIWLSKNWKLFQDLFCLSEFQKHPSDTTLGRVLKNVSSKELQKCISEILRILQGIYIQSLSTVHYALDGKSRSGVLSQLTGRTAIDLTLLSTLTTSVIGKITLEDKKGESTSTPILLFDVFRNNFQNGVITFDCAMTTPAVTKAVIESGNEYIGSLKGFNGKVYEIAEEYDWGCVEVCVSESKKGHGRKEERNMKMIELSKLPEEQRKEFSKYSEADIILKVERHRTVTKTNQKTIETAYFIGSSGLSHLKSEEIFKIQRDHWLIENRSNWVRDVVLREDKSTIKSKNASEFLGGIRDLVLSVGFKDGNKNMSEYMRDFSSAPKNAVLNLRSLDSYEFLNKHGIL